MSGLTEGNYQIRVAATNYATQTLPVTLGPGGTPTQNFKLVPNTGTISGTVTAAVGGAGIEGATVACTGTLTCTSTVTSDMAGDYILNPLNEGSYQITASKTGYAPETFTVVVGPGGTPTQPFQLSASTLSVAGSFGAANSAHMGGATLTAKPTTQTGTGDLLVLAIKTRSSPSVTVTGIADSASNVWKKATGVMNGQADEEIWYVPNARAASPSFTVTVSGTTSMAMTVADVAVASTTSPLDQVATSSGTSTTPATGPTPVTLQKANEIVIGDMGWNNTASLSGLTFNPQTAINVVNPAQSSSVTSEKTSEQMAWQVVTTTSTQSLSGTLSGSFAWTGAIATFH